MLFQHLYVKWIEAADLINICKIWGRPLWTSVHRQKCTSQDYNSDSMFLVEDQIFCKYSTPTSKDWYIKQYFTEGKKLRLKGLKSPLLN